MPRTGTTLVERIIASHSAMHSVGETSAFAAEMRCTMAQRPGGQDLEGIGRRYLEQATALRVPARRIVDSLGPGDLAAVGHTIYGVPQNFTTDKSRLKRAIDEHQDDEVFGRTRRRRLRGEQRHRHARRRPRLHDF